MSPSPTPEEALARHFAEDVKLIDQDGARVTVHLPMAAKTAAGVLIRLGHLGFDFDREEGHSAHAIGDRRPVEEDSPGPGLWKCACGAEVDPKEAHACGVDQ